MLDSKDREVRHGPEAGPIFQDGAAPRGPRRRVANRSPVLPSPPPAQELPSMSRAAQPASPGGRQVFSPWVTMLTALGLVLFGLVLSSANLPAANPLLVLALVGGLTA